jgi:hypothetical protein
MKAAESPGTCRRQAYCGNNASLQDAAGVWAKKAGKGVPIVGLNGNETQQFRKLL